MAQVKQLKKKAVNPDYPETARVYLGDPKAEYRPGRETSTFRVEFNQARGFNLPALQEYWNATYGATPAELHGVQFLGITSDDPDILTSALEVWGKSQAGTPVCTLRCNGEEITRELKGDRFTFEPSPCRFPVCTGKTTKDGKPLSCQLNARLKFWLPDFIAETGIMGYFLLNMHGEQSYKKVLGALQPFDSTPGGLVGKRFRLYRVEKSNVNPDGSTGKHWIVHLEYEPQSNLLPGSNRSEPLQIEAPPPAPELTAGNGKAWYTVPGEIDRVLKETGLPPGKAAAKLGLTLDSFQSSRDLVQLWRAQL